MILVTGATGNNGSGIVKELSTRGVPVRAMVRKREQAESIIGPYVEIVEGDFADPASLDTALKGVDRAFLLPPNDLRVLEYQRNFIDAAKRAGTSHIVKLSVFGAGSELPVRFHQVHKAGDTLLVESNLPYTILQPNAFMQNMLAFAGSIKAQGLFYLPAADARISHIDVDDIVAVAVKALTEEGHQGKTYELTGPEALSYVQVADKLSRAIGRDVTYVDISPEQFKEGAMAVGMSEWQADGTNELFAMYRIGEAAVVTDTVALVAQRPPISFDQFARNYAAAFK